jgi:hypothetical protein
MGFKPKQPKGKQCLHFKPRCDLTTPQPEGVNRRETIV